MPRHTWIIPIQENEKPLVPLTIIPEDINILLIGETNAGKSTFVHAFANYVKHGQFSVAEEKEVSYLTPSSLNGTNTSYKGTSSDTGMIPTKNTCSYIFPLPKCGRRIHLIDTPGFEDVFNDVDNFESILTYITQIEDIHAVCFVLKADSSTDMLVQQYHIKFVLSRLEKNASKNIIFLFTHSKGCSPEQTDTVLKRILDQIKSGPSPADIKYGKENVFCLENEVFQILVSAKNAITHSNTIKKTFSEIWDHSVSECWRIIEYILGKNDGGKEILPHKVKNTVLLHNAQKIVSQASRYMVDIANIIEDLERGFILTDDILLSRNIKPTLLRRRRFDVECNTHSGCDLGNAQELIEKMKQAKLMYRDSKEQNECVLESLGMFIKLTAILSCNDSQESYVKYLINQKIQQASTEEEITDAQIIVDYHDLLKRYTKEMGIINKSAHAHSPISTVTDLWEGMGNLKTLKEIKESFETLHKEVITIRSN